MRLDFPTECALALRAQSGDLAARNELIVAHLGLVHSVAASHRRKPDYDDVTQDGVLGLVRAIEDFNPERGCRFATYAWRWIRSAIRDGFIARGRISNAQWTDPGLPLETFEPVLAAETRHPDDGIAAEELALRVRQAVWAAHLNRTERTIVRLRLLSEFPASVQEVATELGMSRQRVHFIEQKLVLRLRAVLAKVGMQIKAPRVVEADGQRCLCWRAA